MTRVPGGHGTTTSGPSEHTMMNDSGAWHDKLQRAQEAIQRKQAEQASRTTATASTTPR
ncbi:hypothetical protein [Amycolatopsis vastitatis]|uniref:hypothetical protein n=1 Tax=Amycolatopsis vastitatis TaxID=1905142 RepID=UPI0013047285|nr:hypothetical protein [Amycolatopsis vastitatis]